MSCRFHAALLCHCPLIQIPPMVMALEGNLWLINRTDSFGVPLSYSWVKKGIMMMSMNLRQCLHRLSLPKMQLCPRRKVMLVFSKTISLFCWKKNLSCIYVLHSIEIYCDTFRLELIKYSKMDDKKSLVRFLTHHHHHIAPWSQLCWVSGIKFIVSIFYFLFLN